MPSGPSRQTTKDRFERLERELAALTRTNAGLRAANTGLARANAGLTTRLDEAAQSFARLKAAYQHALEQLHLMRRRLFVAKAERVDSSMEQLAFDSMYAQVQALSTELDAAAEQASASHEDSTEAPEASSDNASKDPKRKGKARRDLSEMDLPVQRVEILDPELEKTAERISFEESSKLGYVRGGPVRVVIARAIYKTREATTAPDAPAEFVTTPPPPELQRRGFLAPSMIAHLLTSKYLMGVPFYRLEQKLALEGFGLDRGTMSRYAEHIGASLGEIVLAMRAEALATAFCLSTDATGVSIQLGALADRERGPCRKGHFFVLLADRDHVFFEYQAKHTSAVVCEMFRGYSGYLVADAHTIYDALFAGTVPRGQPPDPTRGPPPIEVGCWSHCRRRFWEAAVCKYPLGLEGLRRIDAIFEIERTFASLSPAQRQIARATILRPKLDAFFAWVKLELARTDVRGLVATALGYARNQEAPLLKFVEDGKLPITNNHSERAIRFVATGRKAWLFFGSDDHASAAANVFSLVASCKLHGLDPERYLAEVIRVMPHWPRTRYLELCPRDWRRTRERLVASELAQPLGWLTVPPLEEQEPPR